MCDDSNVLTKDPYTNTLTLTMQVWKRRGYKEPNRNKTQLKLFLRTRGKVVSEDASKQALLDLCEQTLRDEASNKSAVRLFLTPYDDGLAEKKRRQQLIKAGILNAINAPGHVAPPHPKITDRAWKMLRVDVLKGIVFPDVLIDWLQLFMSDFSSLMLKAKGAFNSGKAYAIKYQQIGL